MERTHPGGASSVPAGAGAGAAVAHPTPGFYVGVFVVLFVLTALEVGVTYYRGIPQIPVLLTLALFKGLAIVLFYMHLRFDSRAFSAFFVGGLMLAASMILTFMALFLAHSREPVEPGASQPATVVATAAAPGASGAAGASATPAPRGR